MPRWHVAALGATIVVLVLRLLLFVTLQPIPTGDEIAFYSYAESMAHLDGVPTTGVDKVHPDALQLAKDSLTFTRRWAPVQASDPTAWSLVAEQYEGFQGPVYPAVVTPAYAVGQSLGGPDGAVLAIRLANVAFAAAAIVATYLLGRELFPKHPAIWLGAAMTLGGFDVMATQPALVSNDAIMPLLGAVTLCAAARAWRRLDTRTAVVAGLLLGITYVAKSTTAAIGPLFGLGATALIVRWWTHRYQLIRWLVLATAAAGAVALPWIAWNLHVYGAISGTERNGRLAAFVIGVRPRTWAEAVNRLQLLRDGFWVAEGMAPLPGMWRSISMWLWALVAAGIVAPIVAWRRGDRRRALILLGLAAALPAAACVLVYGALVQAHGYASPVGRHLMVLLPAAAVLISAGIAQLLPKRAALVVVALLITLSAWFAQPAWTTIANSTFVSAAIPGSAPVGGATYNAGEVPAATLTVTATCPVTAIGVPVSTVGAGPLLTGGQAWARLNDYRGLAVFVPPAPANSLEVTLPAGSSIAIAGDASSALAVGDGGRPAVAVVYCPSTDPAGDAWAWAHDPTVLPAISYGASLLWIRLMPLLTTILALAVAVMSFRRPDEPTPFADEPTPSPTRPPTRLVRWRGQPGRPIGDQPGDPP